MLCYDEILQPTLFPYWLNCIEPERKTAHESLCTEVCNLPSSAQSILPHAGNLEAKIEESEKAGESNLELF